MSLQVRKQDDKWAVVERGVVIAGPFVLKDSAVRRMTALEEGASEHAKPRCATTDRPCLCCRTPFKSEGAHNRLCSRCRSRSAEGQAHGLYVPRGLRRAP